MSLIRYGLVMVRTPLTERRKVQTRRDIADAALTLFMRDGYDAVGVDAIAEEAGISDRTFYRYFPAKDDVLSPIIMEGTVELAGFVAGRPPEESLAEAVQQAFVESSAVSDQVKVQALVRILITMPALHARWLNDLRGLEDTLIPVITQRGDLDDTQAHLTAAAVVACIRVTLERSARSALGTPLSNVLGEALRYVAAGASLGTAMPSSAPAVPAPARRNRTARAF